MTTYCKSLIDEGRLELIAPNKLFSNGGRLELIAPHYYSRRNRPDYNNRDDDSRFAHCQRPVNDLI